jgi:hypothetical protein
MIFCLKVTGEASEKQIAEALRRYVLRAVYVQKSLYTLFRQNICFSIIVQYRGVALCGRSLISGVLLTTKTPNLVLGKRF